ncbi:putative DNA/RNA helicase [Desulfonema limicola]|uniref:DNA/RNA helicase n=1 Tax=Desulfonema limicola TaxID=45656 RepID=A0A975GFJ3_9BACT|nr:DEAD/DEAH box helicase [Desulfonema limicola]QTA79317.1 putative DNA/RNA helicase [Desulfonema limicola]
MKQYKQFPQKKFNPIFKKKKNLPKIKPGLDYNLKKIFSSIGIPETQPFKPDPFQIKALSIIENSDCLVTAPTGAGKTWIASEAIGRILKKGGKAWYASPLKALTNSKYIEFSDIFGPENVGILTGDRKEKPEAQIIVGTTEILRNQLYDAMSEGQDIDSNFVILDEAHYLGDIDRGVVWEEVMIYLPPRVPLLMLSATIGNARQIASWLTLIRKRQCIVVDEKKRPVPLFPLFFHPSGTIMPLLSGNKSSGQIYKKVKDFLNNKNNLSLSLPGRLPPFGDILKVLKKYNLLPAIFFLKSRADCDNALNMCEKNLNNDPDKKNHIIQIIENICLHVPHIRKHRQIRHLEQLAVGAHHSGQLPAWKLLIESLMNKGLLDAVFATSTVAAGVNFPARTIVFLNSDRYNGIEFKSLTPTEFHQMTGRAGRRGMDKIGFATAIPGKYMDIKKVSKLINAEPEDVTSQIKINFSMTLNLLLSHTSDQIEELLERSFAAYLLDNGKNSEGHEYLKNDFSRHYRFLIETGYVSQNGQLTEDGIWASQLRVDQPLLIAEGFRKGIFPEDDPNLMAAIIASFVNERETNDRLDKEIVPNKLQKCFKHVTKNLKPFQSLMFERGFGLHPFYIMPAFTMFLWAGEFHSWEKVVAISGMAEGDLAMLILRTADNLRHIIALKNVFPKAAEAALQAVEKILRDPVINLY